MIEPWPTSPAADCAAAPPFDPRRILAATPADASCTYLRDSVTDAGWRSVLYRVGQRNDPAGVADMGTADHPRLTLTHRGSVAVHRRDGVHRRSGWLAPGRSWLVPPGEPLRYEWSGAGTATREIAILVLPGRQLAETAAGLGDRPHGRPARWGEVVLAHDEVIGAVLSGIGRALASGADDLYAESASAFLLYHLLVTYGSARPVPARVGREDARVQAVIDYLRANLHQRVTLADMAGVAGLSQYHFLRVFRAATGETPRRYLTRLRVEAARQQLREPELSITEIATVCGFGTASHLSTAFRRETGSSPRSYRQQHGAR